MRAIIAYTLAAAVMLASSALAHDPFTGSKNAVGALCCGERDCKRLEDGAVTITPQGYRVVLPGEQPAIEMVPFDEAQPLPRGVDGYWRCFWGGQRKCFFAPPGTT